MYLAKRMCRISVKEMEIQLRVLKVVFILFYIFHLISLGRPPSPHDSVQDYLTQHKVFTARQDSQAQIIHCLPLSFKQFQQNKVFVLLDC